MHVVPAFWTTIAVSCADAVVPVCAGRAYVYSLLPCVELFSRVFWLLTLLLLMFSVLPSSRSGFALGCCGGAGALWLHLPNGGVWQGFLGWPRSPIPQCGPSAVRFSVVGWVVRGGRGWRADRLGRTADAAMEHRGVCYAGRSCCLDDCNGYRYRLRLLLKLIRWQKQHDGVVASRFGSDCGRV